MLGKDELDSESLSNTPEGVPRASGTPGSTWRIVETTINSSREEQDHIAHFKIQHFSLQPFSFCEWLAAQYTQSLVHHEFQKE